MDKARIGVSVVAGLIVLALCGCEKKLSIDWSAPENFFAVDNNSVNEDGGTRLEFHSLIDAPADGVYEALSKPEDYSVFVDGVSESGLLNTAGNTKTTYITQKVIGRQNRAEVKWTLHPEQKKIEFETVKSDLNYNDGSYQVIPSPDGKRTYVISIYNLRLKGSTQAPPGVVATGTREAFKAAATSVKRRALGQSSAG